MIESYQQRRDNLKMIKHVLVAALSVITINTSAEALYTPEQCQRECLPEKICKFTYKKAMCDRECGFNSAQVCRLTAAQAPRPEEDAHVKENPLEGKKSHVADSDVPPTRPAPKAPNRIERPLPSVPVPHQSKSKTNPVHPSSTSPQPLAQNKNELVDMLLDDLHATNQFSQCVLKSITVDSSIFKQSKFQKFKKLFQEKKTSFKSYDDYAINLYLFSASRASFLLSILPESFQKDPTGLKQYHVRIIKLMKDVMKEARLISIKIPTYNPAPIFLYNLPPQKWENFKQCVRAIDFKRNEIKNYVREMLLTQNEHGLDREPE